MKLVESSFLQCPMPPLLRLPACPPAGQFGCCSPLGPGAYGWQQLHVSCLGCTCEQVGNFFFVAFTEMVAEGMTLGEKNGIKRDWIVQFVKRMFPGFLAEGA